jgi:hypothetical protein
MADPTQPPCNLAAKLRAVIDDESDSINAIATASEARC